MASTVTFADLRGLARLYRDGIDGAKQEISKVIRNDVEQLPSIVGFPPENLHQLADADDPVDLLVITIEAAARRARDDRRVAQKRIAHQLASALAVVATERDSSVALSPRALFDIVSAWPGRGMLGFGDRGGVGIPGLRAFLRACRSVDELEATLTTDTLVLRYATSSSRGAVRLLLHPLVDDDSVVIPLSVRPLELPLTSVVAASRSPSTSAAASRAARLLAPSSTRPGASFMHRFLEAMSAVVGGAP